MKTILVPVDFSKATEPALKVAEQMARAFSAELVLLHVATPEPEFIGYEPGPVSVRQAVAHQLSAEHKQLHALKEKLGALPVPVVVHVAQGYIAEKILTEAGRISADLIVMGSHGHGGLHHLLMGSVAEAVLRKATCPVLLTPPTRAA